MRFTLGSLFTVISVTCVLLAVSSQYPILIPISVVIGGAAASRLIIDRDSLWLWPSASAGGTVAMLFICIFEAMTVDPPLRANPTHAFVASVILGLAAGSLVQIASLVERLITSSRKVYR